MFNFVPCISNFFLILVPSEMCGCLRIEEGSEGLQYYCEDVIVHGPKEERCSRKERDEPKYFKGFQVGTRFRRERKRISGYRGSF